MTDIVLGPLVLLDVLFRAIFSSGRGLVAPAAMLVMYSLGLLRDRRRRKAPLV
jgi:hypothetical protein